MTMRHVSPDCAPEQIEGVLGTMGFERTTAAHAMVTSTWVRDGVVVHVGDLGFEEPCAYLVTADGPAGIAGDVAAKSGEDAEPIDFVYAFDAVAFFEASAAEIGLDDDGGVLVVDVPDDELLFQIALVGACATGDDVDPDAIAILSRAARSPTAALRTAAIEAIAWSTWPALGEVLDAVAADARVDEDTRSLARGILDARRASGWSIWPVVDGAL